MARFKDRKHAGKILAKKIDKLEIKPDNLYIVAIPNGGIPVGIPIAARFQRPLYVLIARKIQYPWTTESGYGALTSDGIEVYNENALKRTNLTKKMKTDQKNKAMKQILDREEFFYKHLLPQNIIDGSIIVVDDGLASGITTIAAIKSLLKRDVSKIFLVIPTAHKESINRIEKLFSEYEDKIHIIAEDIRSGFSFAVASAYDNWYDETKEETKRILDKYNSIVIKKE